MFHVANTVNIEPSGRCGGRNRCLFQDESGNLIGGAQNVLSMFLGNSGIYRQVHVALLPRTPKLFL
jgi:hypothetical protein